MRSSKSGRSGALAVVLWAAVSGPAAALTLEEAIAQATGRNERVEAAGARAEAAEARVEQARAFFFPDVSVAGSYTRRFYDMSTTVNGRTFTTQPQNQLVAVASASITVFDARAFPLLDQARRLHQAARLQVDVDRREVGFDAASAFLQTLGAEQVRESAKRRLELAQTTLAEARARFQAQLAGSNDVTRAELEVATAERDLTRAASDAETARLALGDLLAMPVEGPLTVPEGLLAGAAQPPGAAEALIEQARSRREDLAARAESLAAAESAAEAPGRGFIPNLKANAEYRVADFEGQNGRNDDGYVGVTLAWPFYDGGERSAQTAERQAQVRELAAVNRAAVRGVEREVRASLVALGSGQSALQQAALAVEAARRNVNEAEELYRQGLARALEVADAHARLFEAEVARAREAYGLGLAFLGLRQSLGLDATGQVPGAPPQKDAP